MQLWLDYELEALRWGVDPDVSREGLAALVESSAVRLGREEHREIHAEDFVRWGRRGGLRTVALYGAPWFSLLALRRWEKVGAETLAEHLAARQLLYHRERLRWMAARMEDNAAALRTYLVARGRKAAVLPGGYAVGLADDREVVGSGPRAAEGHEQLEIPEILEIEHD